MRALPFKRARFNGCRCGVGRLGSGSCISSELLGLLNNKLELRPVLLGIIVEHYSTESTISEVPTSGLLIGVEPTRRMQVIEGYGTHSRKNPPKWYYIWQWSMLKRRQVVDHQGVVGSDECAALVGQCRCTLSNSTGSLNGVRKVRCNISSTQFACEEGWAADTADRPLLFLRVADRSGRMLYDNWCPCSCDSPKRWSIALLSFMKCGLACFDDPSLAAKQVL